jgi:DNA-binding transcriptional LysR family regulator
VFPSDRKPGTVKGHSVSGWQGPVSRPLNFRQIEAFRAVMLTGTTIAAAEMLNTTQPSVSRLLAQIQSATKLKLFELGRGRLQPTPEAAKLFEAVQRNFAGLEKIEETIGAIRRSGTGLLRVACTPALGISVLPKVITAFQQRHPDVNIVFRTTGSHYVREGLLNGLFDVGLSTNRFRFSDEELRTDILDQAQAVCVMSKTHAFAGEPGIAPKHFQTNNLLTLDSEDDLSDAWRRILAQKKILPRAVIETSHSATICTLAEAGAGIGVVNPYIASIFADRLHIAPIKPQVPVKTFVVRRRHVPASTLTSVFISLLARYFESGPAAIKRSSRKLA